MKKHLIAIGVMVSLFSCCLARASDIYVPDDQPTIQNAINAAVDGDTVIVRAGTYVENIDFVGKAIIVKSETGANSTTIDGNQAGSVVKFISGEGVDTILEGFTLTNGTGTFGPWAYMSGGGIFCDLSSPIIVNNLITGNTPDDGGGIYCCYYSSPTISHNSISGNNAMQASGGGIYCDGSSCSPIITNNIISDNQSGWGGGGIGSSHSSPTISNNIITGNTASLHGGGISCSKSAPTIINNTISENSAGVEGGGIFCYQKKPVIVNTILWENSAPTGPEIHLAAGSDPIVAHCDVKGGWPGTGNIDADPLFAEPSNNDFHLTWDSPCREAGYNAAPGLPTLDFEGDPRIHESTVDIGADEFHLHLYGIGDVIAGSTIDVRVAGPPSSRAWLLLGSGIQDPPQPTWFGDLHLELPLLKAWHLGLIPGDGILCHPATVPGWSSGEVFPLQAKVFVGQWKLSNLLALTVE